MKIIYISGSYRNQTEWGLIENIRHAEQEAIKLWQEDWAVVCPHKNTAHFGGLCEDDTWLRGDLEILSRCDAIYLLKNWSRSEGAQKEYALARRLGLEIYYERY